jgi:hypothetical protein
MSAQTDRLLVWRSIRCDPPSQSLRRDRRPGNKRTLNTLGLKTSLGRSTRTGSRSSPRVSAHLAILAFLGPRHGPILMRLPSARGGAWAPPVATPLRFTGKPNRLQGHSESLGPSPLRSRTRTTTRTITKEVASAARETSLVPS